MLWCMPADVGPLLVAAASAILGTVLQRVSGMGVGLVVSLRQRLRTSQVTAPPVFTVAGTWLEVSIGAALLETLACTPPQVIAGGPSDKRSSGHLQ